MPHKGGKGNVKMKSAIFKRDGKNLFRFALLLLCVLCLCLTGCESSFLLNKNKPQELPPDQGTEAGGKVDEIPLTPVILPTDRYTGLACDEAVSSCRPISVCVGNFDGKPQYGLSFADILVETPIENGQTRLWAIGKNWKQLEKIDKVSSVRDHMMPFVRSLGCLTAYAGTTDTVGVPSTAYPGDNLDYVFHNLAGTFQKDESGSLYTTGTALEKAAKNSNYTLADPMLLLPYRLVEKDSTVRPGGNPVTSVKIGFSASAHVEFQYDTEKGVYVRYQNEALHTDAQNGEGLTFANVLVLFHNVTYYHSEGNTTFSLDTNAGGSGFCYTGGGTVRIRWQFQEDGSLLLRDENGDILTLNRGKSYFAMMKITDTTSVIAK